MSEEANKEIAPVINQLYPQYTTWRADVGLDKEVETKYSEQIPTFQELREKEPDGYTLKLTLYVITNMDVRKQTERTAKCFSIDFVSK